MIEKSADIAQVGEYDGVIECSGQNALVGDLLKDAVDAAGAMRSDGHGEACFTCDFGVRAMIEEHGHDLGIAGGEGLDKRGGFIFGTVVGIGLAP